MTYKKVRKVKNEAIQPGDLIALSDLDDATRFEVVRANGRFTLTIRQQREPHWPEGREYAEQTTDRSLVFQHWRKVDG